MSVLLECIECGAVENEFPSADFRPDEHLGFQCPNCDFSDMILPGQSIAEYAKEFNLKITGG